MKFCTLLLLLLFLSAACNLSSPDSTDNPIIEDDAPVDVVVASTYASSSDELDKTFPFNIDLKTAEGKIVNSSTILKNKKSPTVLLFWLTTCYPCAMELNAINSKYEQWQNETDFKLIAISTDFEKNYGSFVNRVKGSNWPFEAYNDFNRDFWRVMPGELNGLPQVFVYDENGELVYHKRKYQSGDEDILFEKVKSLNSHH